MNRPWILQPWVRILLTAVGGLVGCAAYLFVSPALIAAVSKTSAVFIGTAWVTVMAFALKVADITEAPALTPEEHAALEAKARGAVRRIWGYAGIIAALTAVVLAPSVMVDAKIELEPVWVVAAGGAIGYVVHVIVLHAAWQEELRQFRSDLRVREREEKRAEEMRKRYGDPADVPLSDELRSEIAAHNKTIDWPLNNGPH